MPMSVRDGLTYLDMRKPTDKEFAELPHVVLTSDIDWDPTVLDYEHDLENDNVWYDTLQDPNPDAYEEPRFGETGDYIVRHAAMVLHSMSSDETSLMILDETVDAVNAQVHNIDAIDPLHTSLRAMVHETKPKEMDWEKLRNHFAGAPVDVIKRTFKATTQLIRNSYRLPMEKHYRTRFPAMNVRRRHEPVATDTVFSDTPAIDDGSTAAQLFVGLNTHVVDVYPMKNKQDSTFVGTLEDNIRKRGAMDKLVSDNAKEETGRKVKDILRSYCIDDWQSEAHHQHQNGSERRWGKIKNKANATLNLRGAPASAWLLCIT